MRLAGAYGGRQAGGLMGKGVNGVAVAAANCCAGSGGEIDVR